MTVYLHISEFSGLGATAQSDSVPCVDASANVANQRVAIGGGSTQSNAFWSSSPAQSDGANAQGQVLNIPGTKWVLLTAGAACAINFGTNPTAVAGGWFMEAGEQLLIRVPQDLAWKVAVITDAA